MVSARVGEVSPLPLTRLRRQLAVRGLVPVADGSAGGLGRAEDAAVRPARLVQDPELAWYDCGSAEPCPEDVAFLDGIQRHRVVAYDGPLPLVIGTVAAAVLRREGRNLRAAEVRVRRLAIAREGVLAAAGPALDGLERVTLDSEEIPHAARDLDRARAVLDQHRGTLEVEVGDAFRRRHRDWVVVDGSLAESPVWAADDRMIGVAKSHATLPFEGPALSRYLSLPVGHRTSIFQPASRRVAPVWSWGLRLRAWEGRDPFHGLVRIEAAPGEGTIRMVDDISRWILAERAPLSTPDRRWDRQLYGMRAVERYLESRGHAP